MDFSHVHAWRDKLVFVVGDIILDKFVYGTVERISPEAPIPVLHFAHETYMLGGAANVARNIVSLGGKALLAGVIGNDAAGEIIGSSLAETSRIGDRLVRATGVPTIMKTRFISGSQQILRMDVETKLTPDEFITDRICESLIAAISEVDAIVLSDYAKGVLHIEQIRRLISIARDHDVPVIVDPKRRDVECYAGATVITPNASEAAMITHQDCVKDDAVEQAARLILDRASAEAVIITRGPQGMTLLSPAENGGQPLHIPTFASEVFDVSGAGDTVVATLALAISAGCSFTQSAQLANAAAGIVVGKRGTATVHAQELAQVLKSSLKGNDSKIVSPVEAASIVNDWKANGETIGFTNGCFDLIHPGHVRLLQRAKSNCDRLLVAINSDASVKRLKGASRPIQDEASRALIMAAMECVDLVLVFDDDTPFDLIAALVPDVLIKGADYTVETVVGADVVKANGGTVVLVPLEVGHSTTSMIASAATGV